MKKIIAGILTGLMLLSLIGCGTPQKEENSQLDGKTIIQSGVIASNQVELNSTKKEAESDAMRKEIETKKIDLIEQDGIVYVLTDNFAERVNYFNSLTDLSLQLESDKLDAVFLPKSSAEYLMKQRKNLVYIPGGMTIYYSMGTSDKNKDLRDDFNNAIKELKDNGKLKELEDKHLTPDVPEDIILPKFEEAKTVKVGITGAIPPLDYMSESGKPAGYNIALLSEIANILKINIEIVPVETDSKLIALESGKIDVIFWNQGLDTKLEDDTSVLFTDVFFADEDYILFKKDRDLSAYLKERFPNYTEEELKPISYE